MRTPEEIAALMPSTGGDPSIQLHQTSFRVRLVEQWSIRPGDRVLEIGCGQGDTTAVLAEAVGPNGKVVAVDIADPSYGSPLTVGEATEHLAMGPLGDRIDFRFRFDILGEEGDPLARSFDVVALSLSTWYLESADALSSILRRSADFAPRLCLAEWDLQPRTHEQFGHWLAIQIQGQVEAYKTGSESNVRSPYSQEELLRSLGATEWSVVSQATIDAFELEDARWEIARCLQEVPAELSRLPIPARSKRLISSQLDVLRRLENGKVQPLPVYSIVALRATEAGPAG